MRITDYQNFREILKEELSERLTGNPQYSLRAFARDLGVSAAQVSHVLSGRKGLSSQAASKIGKKLGWNAGEIEYFQALVIAQHGRGAAERSIAKNKINEMTTDKASAQGSSIELQLDAFRAISEWHHFPILELLKTKTAPTARVLSKRLQIQEIEAQLALERLERLELIEKTARGYRVLQDTVFAKENVPSDAIKKFHKQILDKAKTAIQEQPIEERYFRSECLPIRVKSITKAQEDIRNFFSQFVKNHSAVKDGEEIYALSTQFFRLTEKEK